MRAESPRIRGAVSFFQSRLLADIGGLEHAFPCRTGEPGESLEGVTATLRDAFGMEANILVKQVHGKKAVVFDGDSDGARALRDTKADAAITGSPGLAAGIRTADCVPILIADPATRVVAAVHGGWRGIVGGVVAEAVEKMVDSYNADPQDMVAAVGPHIMSCCYEVGPEVIEAFEKKFGKSFARKGSGDRSFLDLSAATVESLVEAGLQKRKVDTLNMCTHCEKEYFYSYRRDGKGTGRQLSFIFFRAC